MSILDIGNEVLELCERNAETNKPLYAHQTDISEPQHVLRIRELDWTQEELSTGDNTCKTQNIAIPI